METVKVMYMDGSYNVIGGLVPGRLPVVAVTSAAPVSRYDYTYDTLGRRDTLIQTPDPADTLSPSITAYTPDNLNQYDAIDTNGAVDHPVCDADGNLTQMALPPEARMAASGDMVLSWNGENRLIAAAPATPADGDLKVEFTYDYMGRRVQKLVFTYDAANTTWTQGKESLFIYDNWNLIEEQTTLNSPTPETHRTHYVWGLDLSQSPQGAGGVGGLLAVSWDAGSGTTTWYYCHDANGNVGQMVDAADGAIVAQYDYAPFGGLIHKSGALADDNVFRFSTKYFDKETGLYHYTFRDYDTESGRWTSRDPLGERGGLNLYGFVGNDGVNRVDPFGLRYMGAFQDQFYRSYPSAYWHDEYSHGKICYYTGESEVTEKMTSNRVAWMRWIDQYSNPKIYYLKTLECRCAATCCNGEEKNSPVIDSSNPAPASYNDYLMEMHIEAENLGGALMSFGMDVTQRPESSDLASSQPGYSNLSGDYAQDAVNAIYGEAIGLWTYHQLSNSRVMVPTLLTWSARQMAKEQEFADDCKQKCKERQGKQL